MRRLLMLESISFQSLSAARVSQPPRRSLPSGDIAASWTHVRKKLPIKPIRGWLPVPKRAQQRAADLTDLDVQVLARQLAAKAYGHRCLPSTRPAQEIGNTKAYGRRSLPSTQPAELSLTRIKQQVVFGSDVYCSTWPAQESSIKDQHVLIQINRSQSRIREQLMEVVSLLIK
eukprot:scaffold202698_cov16-Tisochrysis_lutea.AAC.2